MEGSQNYILSKIFQILYSYWFGVWDHSSGERKRNFWVIKYFVAVVSLYFLLSGNYLKSHFQQDGETLVLCYTPVKPQLVISIPLTPLSRYFCYYSFTPEEEVISVVVKCLLKTEMSVMIITELWHQIRMLFPLHGCFGHFDLFYVWLTDCFPICHN